MPSDSRARARYDSLRADDHDEFDAGLEETIDLDEKDYLDTTPRSRRQRALAAISPYRWLLDGLLIILVVGLLVERQWTRRPDGAINEDLEVAGDITGFAPRFSQKIVTFQPDPLFLPENASDFWTPAVRQRWLGIVPKGLGYLQVENPEKYHDLPTPLVGYKGFTVTTSMTHQLHCLHAIAEVYSAYASGKRERMPSEGGWHLAHCFDYIRQGIMCAGDIALEGTQTTFPDGFVGSDGWDAKHVCKNYDQVLDYLDKNRANDAVWI